MKNASIFYFRMLTIWMAVLDFFCLEAALAIGYWIWLSFPWHGHYQLFSDYSQILWILPPLGLIVFKGIGLYKPEMGVIGVEEQSLIFKAIWILYSLAFGISFFYRGVNFSRLATFYSILIAVVLISLERYLFRRYLESLYKRGKWVQRALIYGAGYHGQRLERWIRQSPKLGIQVVGFLDDDLERLVKKPTSPACLGSLEDIKKLAARHGISVLFVAHRSISEAKIIEIFQLCEDLNIKCWAIPSFYQFYVEKIQMIHIGGVPLVGYRETFGRGAYLLVKRALDLAVILALLPLILPVMAFVGIGIWLASGNPIFFRQIRVGENGKNFVLLKFRTLKGENKYDAISPELRREAESISPFASFLRQSGLDELPQFINVLEGSMSIVGPRPEMPFIVEKYGPLERERLSVKPGITGLWQISEDRKKLLIHENMDYDLYYSEHLSFNLDLAILVKTALIVFSRMTNPQKARITAVEEN